jgi:hypothetical protein
VRRPVFTERYAIHPFSSDNRAASD